MGVAPTTENKLTRCGLGEAASDENNMYADWYHRFVAVFGVLALIVMIGVMFDDSVSTRDSLIVIGTVLAMMGWFWSYGQWDQITTDLHAIIYLVGNIVGIVVCIRLWDTSSMLLFAVYWFGFAYLYTRYAIAYAFVLTLATQWAFGTFSDGVGFNTDTLAWLGIMAVLLGVSAMMAKYIEAFQVEASRNRALLDQLKRTQQSLIEGERAAGIDAERKRMAGEIHDTIAQHFASIITNLRAARELESTEPALMNQHLTHAFSAAQQGLADSRTMLSTMQPDVLLGRSLDEAIRGIVDEWSTGNQSSIELITEGQPGRTGRAQESMLVRGLQESLRNISKHAHASRVDVRLSWLENEVLMDVTDDGVGFDPSSIEAGTNGYRLGLATMQSRVESAGGTFALESAPGEGTSITISFPTGGEA